MQAAGGSNSILAGEEEEEEGAAAEAAVALVLEVVTAATAEVEGEVATAVADGEDSVAFSRFAMLSSVMAVRQLEVEVEG